MTNKEIKQAAKEIDVKVREFCLNITEHQKQTDGEDFLAVFSIIATQNEGEETNQSQSCIAGKGGHIMQALLDVMVSNDDTAKFVQEACRLYPLVKISKLFSNGKKD